MIVYTDKWKLPFQIDDEDFEIFIHYTWNIDNGGYPSASVNYASGQRMRAHVLFMGQAPEGLEWDHENRDKLDNRRFNLRLVTHSINSLNRQPRSDNQSGVTGVCFINGKWRAYGYTKKYISLGTFSTIEEAIAARIQWQNTNSGKC